MATDSRETERWLMPLWVPEAPGAAGKPEAAADQALASHPMLLELLPLCSTCAQKATASMFCGRPSSHEWGWEGVFSPEFCLPFSSVAPHSTQVWTNRLGHRSHTRLPTQRGQNLSWSAARSPFPMAGPAPPLLTVNKTPPDYTEGTSAEREAKQRLCPAGPQLSHGRRCPGSRPQLCQLSLRHLPPTRLSI